ncbi:MAG: hypothetical protein M1837_005854 [Sclerophora amabilis]|nr:MAG: hypothetical protein M1837_005854 [Sclerophora amabilis]
MELLGGPHPDISPALWKIRTLQTAPSLEPWRLNTPTAEIADGARYANNHGPPIIQNLSRRLTPRLTAWQQLVITLLWLYVSRNFGKLLSLECPEPLANLYTRSYFRATWVTTALDAGFWTAMRIRQKWLRELSSIVFTVYYLFAAEQADEKVRKVRGTLTVDHLRVSWNKSTTPYLSFITKVLRPRFTRYPPRAIRIPRPRESAYEESVNAWLYFDGPISALKNHTKIVLDIPGGGFVAMNPRTSDDKLLAWAGKSGVPVLSLDYKKAPEHPYPYALNECYDVYHTLVDSRGRCIGLSGSNAPKIILTGDSAGGNLATGVILMILQATSSETRTWEGQNTLPVPAGLILIYPGLDMNIGNWMTEEQMSLIKDQGMRKTNLNVLRRKSEDYNKLTPRTPHHSDDEDDTPLISQNITEEPRSMVQRTLSTFPLSDHPNPTAAHVAQPSVANNSAAVALNKPKTLRTRLAMSSMISYFNDRILTPEMMRAMIILYVGPHNRPDFSTDYLLSPLLAPDSLLARLPKTYFLTGERDPLVDDTVIFAGRIRQAKYARWMEQKELGVLSPREIRTGFKEADHVRVALIPGISHGFLQFVGVFPEGWKHITRCVTWMEEIFNRTDENGDGDGEQVTSAARRTSPTSRRKRHHRRTRTESSGDDDWPLEMSVTSTSANKTAHSNTNGTSTASRRNGERETGNDRGGANDGADSAEGGRNSRRTAAAKLKIDLDQSNWERAEEEDHHNRSMSTVSLASEDDLLGRRMKGLTGGLMGEDGN